MEEPGQSQTARQWQIREADSDTHTPNQHKNREPTNQSRKCPHRGVNSAFAWILFSTYESR